MTLADRVHTLGSALRARYGVRVHKLAIDAGFTCPNRDGTRGVGGCTFCNNASFSPLRERRPSIGTQIRRGQAVIARRTRAPLYLAYFQSYSNTYGPLSDLRSSYDEALSEPGVVGLSIGTRPDCIDDAVLDLLSQYQARGYEVWLELGLQSACDDTLRAVNRGHGFSEYRDACLGARSRGLPVCTHLMAGLPGEDRRTVHESVDQVLALGVDGLKLHPVHVVRGTRLAADYRRGAYHPMSERDYIELAAEIIARVPYEVVFHRLTGTCEERLLLAPQWCARKWSVLNGIEQELVRRGWRQGDKARECRT